MADLTVQSITSAGVTPTYGAAAAGGDTFLNDTKTFLVVKNGGGSSITVTITSQEKCSHGFQHDLTVTVANASEKWIGPFGQRFNDANSKVAVAYTGVTSVTVGAVSVRY